MHKILNIKDKHLAKLSSKLGNPDTDPKTYRSIINRFLKIPIIPPVLFDDNLISDFEKKLNFLIITLPHNVLWSKMQVPYQSFSIWTIKLFWSKWKWHSIIKKFNTSKAHGWDKILIRMIKLCSKTIAVPLKLIFRSMVEVGVFPGDWKKRNVVPIHKRDPKNLIKKYRPISLLSIFSKVF